MASADILFSKPMAFITISGGTGCRTEEVARAAAHRLHFELINEGRLDALVAGEFGGPVPDKAWADAVTSIAARLGSDDDLIIAASGSEHLLPKVPGVLRVWLAARIGHRSGNLMLDHRTDRGGATAMLKELESEERRRRKSRFGRVEPVLPDFDLVLNSESFDVELAAGVIEAAATAQRSRLWELPGQPRRSACNSRLDCGWPNSESLPPGKRRWHGRFSATPAKSSSPSCWTSTASPGSTNPKAPLAVG